MKHEIKPFAEESDDDGTDVQNLAATNSEHKAPATGDTKSGVDGGNGASLEDNSVKGVTAKCEVKEYVSRYSLKGEPILKAIDDKRNADAVDEDETLYAMRYYKYYNRDGEVQAVHLKIFSPHVQEALRSVVKFYPEQNVTADPVFLEGSDTYESLACLYHYRVELDKYASSLENTLARLDVRLALKLVDRELKRYIERYKAHVESPEDHRIVFSDMWMIFKPGELVVVGRNESERIAETGSISFSRGGYGKAPSWNVVLKIFAHDGKTFGYFSNSFKINTFKGTKRISSLFVRPLAYHDDEAGLRQRQISRGRIHMVLVGLQHRAYNNEATAVERHIKPNAWGGEVQFTEETIKINERIMIDHLSFARFRTSTGFLFHDDMRLDADEVTEDDLIRSHHLVPGFALGEKRWCWFRVECVENIDWDDAAFDLLMLPLRQKKIVHALTWQHTAENDTFDDMIKGKGRGCIFLLHGPPGIGKTFTVESVADKVKKPMYVMMSGELGSDIESVEKNLKQVLELVTLWKAVLLIDEADVFLEKRETSDLARNGLVSIFLRTLEYFSGIMFLTTNRVETFDPAFQSRIHLALKYHDLDTDGRVELWKLFLKRTSGFRQQDWPGEALKEIAAVALNGRQIKNTVRTANALALSEHRQLSVDDIRVVLQTVAEFNADFMAQPQDDDPELPKRSLSLRKVGMESSLALASRAKTEIPAPSGDCCS